MRDLKILVLLLSCCLGCEETNKSSSEPPTPGDQRKKDPDEAASSKHEPNGDKARVPDWKGEALDKINDSQCPREFDSLTFTECRPKPTQASAPECTSYELGPVEGVKSGCIPGTNAMSVSGYPGRMDLVWVLAGDPKDGVVELEVQRVVDSATGFQAKGGAKFGRLVLNGNTVEALEFSGALASQTDRKRVKCPGPGRKKNSCNLRPGDD